MDDGIDAGTGHRPRTLLGDDRLPPVRIEGAERGLDRDLHLPGCGRRRSGGRVDRAMPDEDQGPAASDACRHPLHHLLDRPGHVGHTGRPQGRTRPLGLIDNLGMWSPMLDTLALTLTSAILALAIGESIGIWAGLRRRREDLLRLDFMQTMPPYVYLIPAVMFFILGAVPAVVSTVIFAAAPPIRLTALGLRQVPRQMVEVGSAFASRGQMLRKVQLPLALPSILAGVNQCIMLSLSMVIIASLIGAKGIGETIIFAITRVQLGVGFVGGVAVVLLAIVIDRITSGMGHPPLERRPVVHVWTAPLTVLLPAIRGRLDSRAANRAAPTAVLRPMSMTSVDHETDGTQRETETV